MMAGSQRTEFFTTITSDARVRRCALAVSVPPHAAWLLWKSSVAGDPGGSTDR